MEFGGVLVHSGNWDWNPHFQLFVIDLSVWDSERLCCSHLYGLDQPVVADAVAIVAGQPPLLGLSTLLLGLASLVGESQTET